MSRRIVFMAAGLVAAASAHAQDHTICTAGYPTCSYGSVAAAIADTTNVLTGHTIEITEAGTYDADVTWNDSRTLVIESNLDRTTVILEGNSNDIINPQGTGTVTFRGLTIDGNSGGSNDRCIRMQGGSIVLDDVVVRDCARDRDGPAVRAESGTNLTVIDSLFENNSADGSDDSGSAIWFDGTTLLITNSDFNLNVSTNERGGAIDLVSGSATIQGGSFTDNEAELNGGAIYVAAAASLLIERDASLNGTTFSTNESISGSGGAIALEDGATINGATFTGNIGFFQGGAIYGDGGGTLDIDDSTFSTNTTAGGDAGGAIMVQPGTTFQVTGGSFTGNIAGNHGGAVYTYSGGTFDSVTFDDNDISGNGGAVRCWNSSSAQNLSFTDSIFMNNDANYGGAIASGERCNLTVTRVTFDNNTANVNGGGIDYWSVQNARSLTVSDSTFTSNDADDDNNGSGDGGAIYVGWGTTSISLTDFYSNTGQNGGAIYMNDTLDDVDLTRNTFCGNIADGDGGAVRVGIVGENAPRVFQNNIFQDNDATNGGGTYVAAGAQLDYLNNTFLKNSANSTNGGAVWHGGVTGDFINNLVKDSTGGGVLMTAQTGTVDYNGYHNNGANDISKDGGSTWNGSNYGANYVSGDPDFALYTDNGDCADDLLYYNPGSPMIDAGDDTICDPGGTVCTNSPDRSDIGAYGGPQAEPLDADLDGDGFSILDGDCDDLDAARYPTAPEIPVDFVDSNCDDLELCYVDGDGDGAGIDTGATTTSSAVADCIASGVSPNANDCDDGDAAIGPGEVEGVADGVDQNCDNLEECWADADGDGYGHYTNTQTSSTLSCIASGVSPTNDDCDDGNISISPGGLETPVDGIDQDCDGGDDCYEDLDGDTYGSNTIIGSANLSCTDGGEADNNGDCNDGDAAINPGASEVVGDGIDQDCDTDELCYADGDNDGYGGVGTTTSADLDCNDPGEATTDTDCDDGDGTVNPGATEIPADNFDQNCDTDELCYVDDDGDGFGADDGSTVVSTNLSCAGPGEADDQLDCDDTDNAVAPGATELPADGVDQDCNGSELCYVDGDGDGDGNDGGATTSSGALDCIGGGVSPNTDDCDDTDPTIFVGATEIVADGVDQDCDNLEECYADVDGDGYAGASITGTSSDFSCSSGGYSPTADDCNDSNVNVNPGATEIAGDLQDQDCDGQELCFDDLDGDGFGSTNTSLSPDTSCSPTNDHSVLNTDCDDGNPAAYPGATETVADGVDQDCDSRELCYDDQDNDDHGTTATTPSTPGDLSCSGAFVAPVSDDCDDGNANVFPGNTENPANDLDENCDGFEVCFQDDDLDGFGDLFGATQVSSNVLCTDAGTADSADDCDDSDATIFPGAPETPRDGIDQDCDGVDLTDCYEDLDGDGFGTPNIVLSPGDYYCTQPGHSLSQSDCDDTDPLINPNGNDSVCDGVDSDCDGFGGPTDDEDLDNLTWDEEQVIGTDGCDPDTDGDTITDGLEENDILSNPLDPDTDGDDVGDQFEIGPNPLNPRDLDGDGIYDILDLDDDGDGVNTIDEDYVGTGPRTQDSDGDGLYDYEDFDDDGDSVLTTTEDTNINGDPTDDDCDGDGIPDYLDTDDDDDGVPTLEEELLGSGRCNVDSDGDQIPDGIEWLNGDTNGDGEPDILDIDDDGDGIFTFEEAYWAVQDVDGDGLPNHIDLDSDGDGNPDAIEGTGDLDNDGIPNWVDPDDYDGGAADTDGDGLLTVPDEQDLGSSGVDPDSDNDGVDDGSEVIPGVGTMIPPQNLDTDGDLIPDILDTDDDGDGIDTRAELGDECGDGSDVEVWYQSLPGGAILTFTCGDGSQIYAPRNYRDTDGDTVPDYLDADDDGDGVDTFYEDRNGNSDWTDDDMDADGTPDWLDAQDQDGPSGDMDQDGISNGDELANGSDPFNADSDGDGISDGVEGFGDSDGDGTPDALDDDDDGDGIPSSEEGSGDPDGDGIPNRLDEDSDGDGTPDVDEGTGDVDCDSIPNWADPDDADNTCNPLDSTAEVIKWDGCDGCDSNGGSAGWMALGLVALGLRRRRRDQERG